MRHHAAIAGQQPGSGPSGPKEHPHAAVERMEHRGGHWHHHWHQRAGICREEPGARPAGATVSGWLTDRQQQGHGSSGWRARVRRGRRHVGHTADHYPTAPHQGGADLSEWLHAAQGHRIRGHSAIAGQLYRIADKKHSSKFFRSQRHWPNSAPHAATNDSVGEVCHPIQRVSLCCCLAVCVGRPPGVSGTGRNDPADAHTPAP